MTKSETQLTLRDYWREKLSSGTLDELFEEAKTCGHEGSCWDLINILADILEPHTQSLLTSLKSEMEKKKIEVEIWVGGNQSYGHAEKFEAVRLSECQRVIDGYLK